MREENYFKIKLETTLETLSLSERKLENIDIQMKLLDEKYEADKEYYNTQAIRFQGIVSEMKKRIPKLEKRIEKGYVVYDVRNDKGYKSFMDMHIAQLEAKKQWAIDNQKKLVEKFELKEKLKKKKKLLTEEEKEIVEATTVQESLQEKDDIKESQERQIENLKKKQEYYEEQLRKLKAGIPKEEIPKVRVAPEEEIIEEQKDLKSGSVEQIIDKDNEEMEKDIQAAVDLFEEEMPEEERNRGYTQEELDKQWIENSTQGHALSNKYREIEGGHAIWQGKITNGFRDWCEENNLKIGE